MGHFTELTVLVAEDDQATRYLICYLLKHAGFRVLEAANGREALRIAASCPGTIDMLLADLSMPLMNGYDLAEKFKASWPLASVLLTSAYVEALESSPFPVLPKPFDPDGLVDRVFELLELAPEHARAIRRSAAK